MKARLSLSALVAVAAALSLSLSAGAATRPGDYFKPANHGWNAPHADKWGSRPFATAGRTRAAS